MCQPGRIGNFDFVDAEKCQADKRKSNPDPALAPEVSHQYMCQRQERQLSIDHQICRILYIRNENHPKTVSDKSDELTCWHSLRLKANQLQKYTNEMKMNPRFIMHDQQTITSLRTGSVNRFVPVNDGNYSGGYYVRGVHRSVLLACNVQSSAMCTIEKNFLLSYVDSVVKRTIFDCPQCLGCGSLVRGRIAKNFLIA
ncbi:hypothetical protein T09_4018 [Trichinella sp. T9]|nr:hypothetical protein T09_4018 [Trichinella sp. T9]